MKKTKSGKRTPVGKSKLVINGVDEYLASIPEPARTTLNKSRTAIRSVVPPRSNRGHQLWHPDLQIQRNAREFRRVLGSLQPVPGREADHRVQERTQELPNLERHHPLRAGQASPRHSSEQAGEVTVAENERKKGR
jgi:hypothetical protein